jgi:hypothetical protein
MSYLIQESSNFINIKLTDTGRRLLSLGALTFNKVILSDREINYSIARNEYDICKNRILSPKDDQPKISYNNAAQGTNTSINSVVNSVVDGVGVTIPTSSVGTYSFDGSNAVTINSQTLTSAKQIVTAMTNSIGFFSGSSNNFYINTLAATENGKPLGVVVIDYSLTIPSGGTTINFTAGGYSAKTGDLVYIPWEPPQYSGITNSTNNIYSATPNVSLWYRIQGRTGTTLSFDRSIPNFGTTPISGSLQKINAYFYPYGAIESYYGSATTTNCGVWSMNIVRTSSEIGTSVTDSGYTTYGSIEYNGTKFYLGFSSETKAFGIIHYTNKFSGNTYAEQFVPSTVKLEIPNIMWHKKTSLSSTGQEMGYGITLYDYYGNLIFDNISQTYYKELRDGVSSASNVVGRVYHKLKIIVITDQELLNVLTYKSNRNYTLPELTASLAASDAVSNATGLCKSDYSYYVTYITSSKPYQNGVSYGYPQGLPCGYITKINGQNDTNTGLPSVLALRFQGSSFPYMRSGTNLATLSGTGWNANSVQILLQEIATSATTQIADLPTTNWKLISNEIGNGIYTGETGENTINPVNLQAHNFLITQQDYNSGSTYSLSGKFSAFTSNVDSINSSGLTFGNESFFYGNLTTGIQANVFKTLITVIARNDEYNSSLNNPSFISLYDSNTFITEIGILNNNNDLVAVAKPAYPIKKNNSRYLAFQLELDF